MTDTTTSRTADRGSSLASMLLPELKQLAQQLGITGSSGMRKQDLIAAISERQKQGGAPRRTRSASRPAGAADVADR
ncbi:MAG: Rho termination factor N-terminal domain-containing protein, partial [Candidatus Nanopelagicales bacterium]